MGVNNTLVIADYVVIVVMLLVSAGIGVYYRFTGGRQKTTKVKIRIFFNVFFSVSVTVKLISRK